VWFGELLFDFTPENILPANELTEYLQRCGEQCIAETTVNIVIEDAWKTAIIV
jgi:hypothetical protein